MEDYKADVFINELEQHQNENDVERMKRFFKDSDPHTLCLGLHMKTVFQTAKRFIKMPLSEIEKLLESPYYEVRMGAVSIMDFQAKQRKLSQDTRKALFDLYIHRHDRINNWDFVDRSAPSVIGKYLLDRPRDILYRLARSNNKWERRTAIVSTYAFIKQDELDDTFRIAELLIADEEELIQKAVGSWIREAGKRNNEKLKAFLDQYAHKMSRMTLRMAVEKFDNETKQYYLSILG
ncbi:DNA alkylation repair protein [Halalkalibacter sp. APA_J-10(15)]|uniref:DNA alkylation repair protein n=1 Tax=Halalkalibacter sp. APA_J-10(15) TaxID=2933805 RepID=UPI001FF0F430|nr:DNA alkylation repair protein [Halalkalibacter sp. APA_J-10(15)]MCK0471686.1 DNA alkylation repair protein [Halalkalibacter sp. APA_J-10(15)]